MKIQPKIQYTRLTAPTPNARFLIAEEGELKEVTYWKPMPDTPAKRNRWPEASNIQWIPATPQAVAMVEAEKNLGLEVYEKTTVVLSQSQSDELASFVADYNSDNPESPISATTDIEIVKAFDELGYEIIDLA